jgi:hypothetical protein
VDDIWPKTTICDLTSRTVSSEAARKRAKIITLDDISRLSLLSQNTDSVICSYEGVKSIDLLTSASAKRKTISGIKYTRRPMVSLRHVLPTRNGQT